jgi:molybdopterin synthase catalytic subunit
MSDVFADVSDRPLDPSTLDEFVWRREAGAVVSFQGIVRDHDGGRPVVSLDYRAHPQASELLSSRSSRACRSGSDSTSPTVSRSGSASDTAPRFPADAGLELLSCRRYG